MFRVSLLKTIENTRKVGINKLEAMVAQECLSKELFDKILNDVSENTITGDYQTLYDNYIIDTISAYVKYEMVIDLNFTFSNAGTTQNNGQQYRVANMSELFTLKKQFLDNAEVFGEILRKHLEANYATKFPEYKVVGTSYDAVTSTETAYDCSIFLD